jgi:hypothetical protein
MLHESAATREAASGSKRTFGHVRFRAAIGGTADIKRALIRVVHLASFNL